MASSVAAIFHGNRLPVPEMEQISSVVLSEPLEVSGINAHRNEPDIKRLAASPVPGF